MPESPRWLLSKGRVEELKLIIEKAAYWNSRELPPSYEKTLIVSQTASERSVSIFDLFQTGYKKTTFLMAIVWFSIILIYFGITLHMSSLGGNVYINTVCSYPKLFGTLILIKFKFIRLSPALWKQSLFAPAFLWCSN